jgi:hypothetical protein
LITAIGPVIAPAGTIVKMLPVLSTRNVAQMPLKVAPVVLKK